MLCLFVERVSFTHTVNTYLSMTFFYYSVLAKFIKKFRHIRNSFFMLRKKILRLILSFRVSFLQIEEKKHYYKNVTVSPVSSVHLNRNLMNKKVQKSVRPKCKQDREKESIPKSLIFVLFTIKAYFSYSDKNELKMLS